MTTPPPAVTATPHVALHARPRPSHAGSLSASLAFAWRGLLKIKHLPELLIEAIAVPIVFTVMFTYLFGGALAGSTGEYLQFILPGTLVMAVLLRTMYVGTELNTDVSKGVYDRFRSLPVWRPAPIAGALLTEAMRHLLTAALVVALGLLMGFHPGRGVLGVLAAIGLLVVFALSLSWVWIVLGLVMRTPNAIMSLATLLVFPLTMASNIFVTPETMPGWLRVFVNLNPVSHLVTAERGLIHGTVSAGDVGSVLVAAGFVTAVFAPLAIYLYSKQWEERS
jgi:ABC-2 type transport system permease protein